jgi:hypothetical protein
MAGSRALRIGGLLVWMLSSVATAVHAQAVRQPRLAVSIQNQPGVSPDTLAEASRHVIRVYAAAGIEVLWHDYPTPPADADFAVTLIITTRPPSLKGVATKILGIAASVETRCGRVAWALWHHITAFAEAQGRAPGLVLGYVIAHEIGHLLMPPPSHSENGLMRATWRAADLDDAERDRLRFTHKEARVMRHRIAAETTLVAVRSAGTP